MTIEWLRLPTALPSTLDPQVRSYFQALTANLRYFADQVARDLNGPSVTPAGARVDTSVDQMQREIADLTRTVQQLTDRVTKLEAP